MNPSLILQEAQLLLRLSSHTVEAGCFPRLQRSANCLKCCLKNGHVEETIRIAVVLLTSVAFFAQLSFLDVQALGQTMQDSDSEL